VIWPGRAGPGRAEASDWPLAHGCVQGRLDVAERSGRCGVLRRPGQFGGIDVLVDGRLTAAYDIMPWLPGRPGQMPSGSG